MACECGCARLLMNCLIILIRTLTLSRNRILGQTAESSRQISSPFEDTDEKMVSLNMGKAVLLGFLAAWGLNVNAAEQVEEPVEESIRKEVRKRFNTQKFDRIGTHHLDGVKGYKVSIPIMEFQPKDPVRRQHLLQNVACQSRVFGLVKVEEMKVFIGEGDRGIFTRVRFRIVEDWRPRNEPVPDMIVYKVLEGGEIERQGETIRIDNPLADYRLGSLYLLTAGNRNAGNPDNDLYGLSPVIEVVDGILYPDPGSLLFTPGTSVDRAKEEISSAIPGGSCP
jgi:hypothetical protein